MKLRHLCEVLEIIIGRTSSRVILIDTVTLSRVSGRRTCSNPSHPPPCQSRLCCTSPVLFPRLDYLTTCSLNPEEHATRNKRKTKNVFMKPSRASPAWDPAERSGEIVGPCNCIQDICRISRGRYKETLPARMVCR